MVSYQDNKMWLLLEELKHKLRSEGCTGLANELYKRQLLLESEIAKEQTKESSSEKLNSSTDDITNN